MPLRTGTLIAGRFEIAEPIGAGSMGEVYQAHDVRLHRDVALKLLSPSLAASEEHLLRFEREARAASALNHPHICTIYDVGHAEEADGRPYLVMELLRGHTLYEVMARGPMALATVVNVGVQVAEALDAAHAAGIVHRDLKPANVFISARGDAKLLDFGLAGFVAQAASSAGAAGSPPTSLTGAGMAVGTVIYMSPEQALGDPLDPRTDVFSLGLVLYEMLTGRRAFEGRSNTAIIDAILHAVPAGLDSGGASLVPKEIRPLLAKMLQKDRENRPRSAAEVAARLRAIQSGSIAGREYAATQPVSIVASRNLSSGRALDSDVLQGPPAFTPRDPPASESSGLPAALAGANLADLISAVVVLLVLAVAGYAGYSWSRRALPPAAREPLLVADFTNTTGEPVFDGALKDALEIQLQQSPFFEVVPASQIRSTLKLMARPPDGALTQAVARDVCERIGVRAIMAGSIAPLGSAYVVTLTAQACGTGDTIARDQVQAAAKTDVLASVGASSARIRERLGESIGSIQRFNVPAPNATTPSLDALKAYSIGVETRLKTGDVQAIPMFERALELDPDFALAAARLAAIYTNLHELEQAQTYIKRAFARSTSLSEPERLFITSHYHYIVTGRLNEVVGAYRQWINTYPQDWVPHNNLSATLFRLNQADDALKEAQAAVKLGAASVVPYQQLAQALIVLDRFDDARRVLRDAADRGLDSSFNRALSFDLAFLAGDAAGMQEHLRAAESRADSYLVLTEAARAAFASGDLPSGRSLYARAVAASRSARIVDGAGSLLAEQTLASAVSGDMARAQDELQQALAISGGVETAWPAALAAALAGNATQAATLAAGLRAHVPPAPDILGGQLPIVEGAIALADRDGQRALTILDAARPFDLTAGPWLPYLRGLAHEALRDHHQAANDFRAATEHRGNQPLSIVRPIARLQLARALAASGDAADARQAYRNFAAAWRSADPRHPLVVAAAREADALPAAVPNR